MRTQTKLEKIKEHCNRYDEKTCCLCELHDTRFSKGGICYEQNTSAEAIDEMYTRLFKKCECNDPINPAHYRDGKIEVIDFIEDKRLGFHLGNAVKYIARAGKKDPTKEVEDLKKADWYIKRRIKKLEEAKND